MNEIPTAATPGFARLARTGKIARLPAALREQLNRRLEGGIQAKPIVDWLNNLPEVKTVLEEQFEGRLIREQNVSDWRKGGYRDWLAHQQAVEMYERVTEHTEDLQAGAKGSVSDKLSAWLTTKYLVAAQALTNEDGTVDWKRLRELSRDLATLRRGEIWAERLKLEQERFAYQQQQDAADQEALFWEWAFIDKNREKICKGFKTKKEQVRRVGSLLFGELWMSKEELASEQEAAAKEALALQEQAEKAAALYRAAHPEQSGLIRPAPGQSGSKSKPQQTAKDQTTSKDQAPSSRETPIAKHQTPTQAQPVATPTLKPTANEPAKAKIQPPSPGAPGQSGLIRPAPGGSGLVKLPTGQQQSSNNQTPQSSNPQAPTSIEAPMIKPQTAIGPQHSNGTNGNGSKIPLGGQTHSTSSPEGSVPLGRPSK